MIIRQTDELGRVAVMGTGTVFGRKDKPHLFVGVEKNKPKISFVVTYAVRRLVDKEASEKKGETVYAVSYKYLNCAIYAGYGLNDMFELARTLQVGERIDFCGEIYTYRKTNEETGEVMTFEELRLQSYTLPARMASLMRGKGTYAPLPTKKEIRKSIENDKKMEKMYNLDVQKTEDEYLF